jgi:dihydroneopterin aldolase
MATLKTSWQLAAAAGEPHTTIRVRNLQAVVEVGRDAWGRAGKAQPVLISATLSLRAPFDEASAADSVNNKSTVHYGILSKAVLEAAESFRTESTGHTVRALLNHISRHLTGECITLEPVPPAANPHPVVDRSVMTSMMLEVLLPKASLIGDGASLSGTTLYASSGACKAYSMSLKLHGLRIPTLIGVNPNERLAKQIVTANIELEPWASDSPSSDSYNEFEEIVVKVCTYNIHGIPIV